MKCWLILIFFAHLGNTQDIKYDTDNDIDHLNFIQKLDPALVKFEKQKKLKKIRKTKNDFLLENPFVEDVDSNSQQFNHRIFRSDNNNNKFTNSKSLFEKIVFGYLENNDPKIQKEQLKIKQNLDQELPALSKFSAKYASQFWSQQQKDAYRELFFGDKKTGSSGYVINKLRALEVLGDAFPGLGEVFDEIERVSVIFF